MSVFALDRSISPALARWRPVLAWWAISRVVTLLAFLLLEALGPRGRLAGTTYLWDKPLALLGAWDGVWYQRIAQHGYLLVPGSQSNPAFFPLFPILLRGLGAVFGLPYTAAGALVSNLALAVALVAFFELGSRVLGDRERARRAACFMAVSPMAFVFSMTYPESLALALVLLALLSAHDGRWLLAAGLVATAVLARPEALIFALPLGALAWNRRRELDPAARGRALAATLAAPAALLTYPLYLQWSIHDAGAWSQAQERWGRAFNLAGPLHALTRLPARIGGMPLLGRDAALLVVYAALIAVAARRGVSAPWIVSGALVLALPLFSGSVEAEGRFGLLALPVYWGAAALADSPRRELALRLGSLALLVAGVLVLPTFWP